MLPETLPITGFPTGKIPAAADIDISYALKQAAAGFKQPWSSGFVLTRDSFYQGVDLLAKPDYTQLARAHVLAVEMECAALFIVSSLRVVKAGAILTVGGNVLESDEESMESYDPDNIVVYEAIGLPPVSPWMPYSF
jgi:uridine phosphorylase